MTQYGWFNMIMTGILLLGMIFVYFKYFYHRSAK